MSTFDRHREVLCQIQPVSVVGQVMAVRGLTVSVGDFPAPVGAGCRILRAGGELEARVIGFWDDQTLVMPLGSTVGICRGNRVECTASEPTVAVGPGLLGRVVNALGKPIDGGGDFVAEARAPLWPEPIAPMLRRRISEPLATGVRAIDAVLTVGRGQRMGVFSGSGVGKSVLLGMISRYTAADVSVIALIGERGREVRDFVEKDLGPEGLQRAVVVASTSDEPPLVRVQAGAMATAVAEFFRDQGKDVLLLMDSLTRLATAQRQIGLVAGEPPATKGYTPSVFSILPQLLERSGRTRTGSITGFYSVLIEGDDLSDPISEAVRSVTDGHILLSRELAHRGQYPPVDLLRSVSRVMDDLIGSSHRAAAREIRRLVALYRDVEDMVNIGAYQAGSSEEYDHAVRAMPQIRKFMAQEVFSDEPVTMRQTTEALLALTRQIGCDSLPVRPAVTREPAQVT
jgi:flagellum-specific ATP synthase